MSIVIMRGAKLAKAIGLRIILRREKAGYNRLQFARRAGITWSNLQAYEEGRKLPDLLTLAAIAAALRTTASAILRGVESEIV